MMVYQTPITIKEAIDHIQQRNYLLPSIQREFVWNCWQIEKLFDSLMRDYPISTFLFWRVKKDKIKKFQFYEFLSKYHEKECYRNREAILQNNEDIISILDGQQRLTSLYIALTGSYAQKLPYYRRDSQHAYPEKKLYLNLLKPADNIEMEFDFRFLSKEDAVSSDGYFWFECSDILHITAASDAMAYLVKKGLTNTANYSEQQSTYAINTLNGFYNVIHQKGVISYYLEKSEELDKVLQIFIRTNSGGTKLSYSDLLLSIATAQWQEKNARDIIHEFVDKINRIGDGFNFNKDIILKSCLVLNDLEVQFKVDNFTKENMAKIEANWEQTSAAMLATVELIDKLGYNYDNLIANNAILPIAYFIYKNNFEDTIVDSQVRENDRKAIQEWLARVLLKGVFGGTPDNIYPRMRELIKKNLGYFPLEQIIDYYRGHTKSISFTLDDIDTLLELEYGKPKAFCLLSLLYPNLRKSNTKYHQDHIHPQALFHKKALKKMNLSDEEMKKFGVAMNQIPNLQLLPQRINYEKNKKTFIQWLDEICDSQVSRDSLLRENHINLDQSLAFENFLDFFAARQSTLKQLLIKTLGVSHAE